MRRSGIYPEKEKGRWDDPTALAVLLATLFRLARLTFVSPLDLAN